jgi:hypothetical protein
LDARATAKRVVGLHVSPTDPQPFQEAVASAAALSSQLDERIPVVTFIVQDRSSGATPIVMVDGSSVAPGDIASPLRLDPGLHQIVARLGELEATQELDLQERDKQPVVLRWPSTAVDAAASTTMDPPAGSSWRTAGYIGLGLGAGAILVGAITGALAISSKRTAESGCADARCPPSTWDDIARSRNYAAASTISFAAAGTALGIGVLGLALSPSASVAEPGAMRARPRVGLGYIGIDGTF